MKFVPMGIFLAVAYTYFIRSRPLLLNFMIQIKPMALFVFRLMLQSVCGVRFKNSSRKKGRVYMTHTLETDSISLYPYPCFWCNSEIFPWNPYHIKRDLCACSCFFFYINNSHHHHDVDDICNLILWSIKQYLRNVHAFLGNTIYKKRWWTQEKNINNNLGHTF